MSVSSTTKIHVGMDVHKDPVMSAVLPEDVEKPTIVKQLPNEERALRWFLARGAEDGELRCCYEASGAGYVLHRAIEGWGQACEVTAPALIPTRPGHRRKHDRFDAVELARQHRAGMLVPIRVPSEAEGRVRDLVRCRDTFRRELMKSRQYILKFRRRRGFVFRDGNNWTQKHLAWIRSLLGHDRLVDEDRDVLGEYPALVEYKLDRRDDPTTPSSSYGSSGSTWAAPRPTTRAELLRASYGLPPSSPAGAPAPLPIRVAPALRGPPKMA